MVTKKEKDDEHEFKEKGFTILEVLNRCSNFRNWPSWINRDAGCSRNRQYLSKSDVGCHYLSAGPNRKAKKP